MENLDLSSIIRLHTVFKKKNWFNNLGEDVVYKKFCKILSLLSIEERDLILDLTERYHWITYNEYGTLIIQMFENLVATLRTLPQEIILFPLKKREDSKKVKSADSVLYLLSGFIDILPEPFPNIRFLIIDKFEDIESGNFTLSEGQVIFMVDDYLGSGDTVNAVITEVLKNESIKRESITILSLVSHSDAIKTLQRIGVGYSVGLVHHKGISEFYDEPERTDRIELMKRIERRVTSSKKLRFGYQQCEGLITLIKTPNNTFPIFWMDYKNTNERVPPPFPRFKYSRR